MALAGVVFSCVVFSLSARVISATRNALRLRGLRSWRGASPGVRPPAYAPARFFN